MGGNSSSRHVSLDSDDEVTFVKGIRLSEKVIDRMKVSPPVVRPQAPTRSLMQPPTTPPVESSVPDERHVPIMPHSPSYASALVPPPFLEPITPLVPPVTEETSTPPSSEGLPIAAPSGNEHVVVPDAKPGSANILVPDPQPAEPINAPSRVSSETITAPPLVEPTCAPVEPLTPPPVTTSTTEPVTVPPSPTIDPPTEPVTSSVEPLTPPPVTTSTTESVTVPPSATSDPLTEPVKSSVELVVVPTEPIESVETPSSSTLAAEATSADPMDLPVPSPVELWTSPFPISIPNPVPSVMEESPVSSSGSSSDVALPDEMPEMGPPSTEKPLVPRLPPDEEPVVPSSIDPVEVFPPQTHAVNEEKLRVEIREDLQKLLNEEMKMAERNMRQQLEEETAKAKAQAQAAARLQIQEEVHKVLEEEKASYQQTLADAIRREQLNIQDEHLITQYYWMERKAQKLDEKEKDLQNQDALFQEQITKMQEKTAQLTKVMAENHRKGLEDATNRFRRYQIKPVCLDLQSQIMKCYAENKGQTMSCSNIASLYIQCVDRAKQDKKLSTGG